MIGYLIDTSAVNRLLGDPDVRRAWHEPVVAGVVALCDAVELELFFSARSAADRRRKKELFGDLFGWAVTPDHAWRRAHEVQQLLTEEGTHRSAGVADLIIAATAEANDVTLLHYDRDFDTVAKVTGQRTQWIAPPGTAD